MLGDKFSKHAADEAQLQGQPSRRGEGPSEKAYVSNAPAVHTRQTQPPASACRRGTPQLEPQPVRHLRADPCGEECCATLGFCFFRIFVERLDTHYGQSSSGATHGRDNSTGLNALTPLGRNRLRTAAEIAGWAVHVQQRKSWRKQLAYSSVNRGMACPRTAA
eukprot:GHVT01029739.1.p1 GENE.GHVT01029739.1~~GHVT01029739.1.p1  ORF type:complete len:163 (-),score=21.85 GHVT01029739.1:300-788(-)